jgi:hypothetical protein
MGRPVVERMTMHQEKKKGIERKKEFRPGDRVLYTREATLQAMGRTPMLVETVVIRATPNRVWIEMRTPKGPLRKYVQPHHLINLEDTLQ